MLSNAYFLAKFRFDTAENEPAKNLQNSILASDADGAPGGVAPGRPLAEDEHAGRDEEPAVERGEDRQRQGRGEAHEAVPRRKGLGVRQT